MRNAEDESFELNPEAEAELLESIAEADRGDLIPAEEVLRKVRSQRLRRRGPS